MFKRLSDEERAAKKQAEQTKLLEEYSLDFENRSDADLMSHNTWDIEKAIKTHRRAERASGGVRSAEEHSKASSTQNLIIIRQNELLARQNEKIIHQNEELAKLLQNNTPG